MAGIARFRGEDEEYMNKSQMGAQNFSNSIWRGKRRLR